MYPDITYLGQGRCMESQVTYSAGIASCRLGSQWEAWVGGFMLRGLGFRGLGFGGLGFRGLGVWGLGV